MSETINDIVRELRSEPLEENGENRWVHYLAYRIAAAHKHEMKHNESLQSKAGETVVGLMNKMSAQSEEIKKLRALVKELADGLENNLCRGCHNIGCVSCSRSHDIRALVAKAREEVEK